MKKLFLSCIMLLLLSGVCAAVPAFVEQDIDLSDEAISEQSSLLWESDGFYIPEEKVLMAGKKYRAEQLPFIAVIGIVIVVIAIGALAAHFAPIITDSLGELF